jgi:hypothetical protein
MLLSIDDAVNNADTVDAASVNDVVDIVVDFN